jgi:signal transduction histidine kinase/CheY-like chemotaxis protein
MSAEYSRTDQAFQHAAGELDFAALLDLSPNAYMVIDRNFDFVWVSQGYLNATARVREELIGRNLFEAFPQDPGSAPYLQLRTSLDRVLASRQPDHVPLIEYSIPAPDGGMADRFWSCVHTPVLGPDGEVAFILQHTLDVTELHRLRQIAAVRGDDTTKLEGNVLRAAEVLQGLNATLVEEVAKRTYELRQRDEALRQAQKMEVVGQLTGGIAHDFNNLLQIVLGNLEILQRNLPEDAARLRRSTDNAINGARRAATLTQRLLAFSRRQPLAPRALSPNRLITEMSELLHRTLGEAIEIETVLGASVWNVEVDSNQLESAILNLAVNARDAMPNGGKLTIETANTRIDEDYALKQAEVTPGQYVVICVTDTGTGMDKATIERAFEPFFTTKETGRGTGLGLSMVYGFVKQSGGHVKIYSEQSHGTTVKIYLPRFVGELSEDETQIAEHVPEGSMRETILVLEDDDDVRAHSVEILRELGYNVREARDAAAALRLIERAGRIDLLFTDVVLEGGVTGADVVRQAVLLRPALKVLFTTGYARDAIVHQGRIDPGVQLITKPFTYAELARRVRDVLDQPHDS